MKSQRLLWTAVAAVAAVAIPSAAAIAATPNSPLLWYEFDETGGTVVHDSSGNGLDGTVVGGATWGDGLELDGIDDHVDMPDDLMAGLDSITVTAEVWIEADQPSPYFIYGLGNTSGDRGDGYLFTTGNGYRTSVSTCHWTCEQNVNSGQNLTRGTWNHLAYTLTDSTGILYLNGQEIARESVTITPGEIGGGATAANYLGRSMYPGDRYLHGRFGDFRIYGDALPAAEIGDMAAHIGAEKAAADAAAIDLGDTSAVTADLDLPAKGANGSQITWVSSDSAVISDTGAVVRPASDQEDATVTLTANVVLGNVSEQRHFTVTVPAELDDQEAVAADSAALDVVNVDDVRSALHLPTEGANGTTITWKSDNPDVISTDGLVNRDEPGGQTYTVNLKATIERGGEKEKRKFEATVPPLPEQAGDYEGYFFTYFTGEGTANGEQIYAALSDGNDPLRFGELNGGQPILTSDQGDQGVRDPFIIRSPEGDRFYMIATDLKIHGNGDWDGAQRHGSLSIMVWESTDLVDWGEGRLVQVSPESAGNTWAPEAYWDPEQNAYVVFWASKLYENADHSDSTYNRMMYATTRDFVNFSQPQVWVDKGYSTIDSTIIEDEGTFYRFTKDERSNTSGSPCGKFIMGETSTSLSNTEWDFQTECIGSGSINQGEGPLIFKSNTEEKWYMFVDEFGGRGYVPFETTDLSSGEWTPSSDYDLPASPRHGTVLPVTAEEYERLQQAWN
ncbi:immunoglobulin-like domain-containing protein [Glycomyces buryatensis]|uniref:1,4-beta-xylanase n=1 Tax=Glycomyces buryatensis TaxID=2570927 RepID=A0A4S8Q058_9ACTN|nr:immunoglobulin-like domain-containing protein [Glycomyces buryatensis]THV36391.1 1,4-beta-xylanase [Glycomyces buryatensis]